jgi:hypothetical protein
VCIYIYILARIPAIGDLWCILKSNPIGQDLLYCLWNVVSKHWCPIIVFPICFLKLTITFGPNRSRNVCIISIPSTHACMHAHTHLHTHIQVHTAHIPLHTRTTHTAHILQQIRTHPFRKIYYHLWRIKHCCMYSFWSMHILNCTVASVLKCVCVFAGVNSSYLGKHNSIPPLFKVVAQCGRKHTTVLKLALESLNSLTKSRK